MYLIIYQNLQRKNGGTDYRFMRIVEEREDKVNDYERSYKNEYRFIYNGKL